MKKHKSLACFLLAGIIMVNIAGCRSTASTDITTTATVSDETMAASLETEPVGPIETFQGSAPGHNGEIKVEVTMSDGNIKKVTILEHSETPTISDLALTQIPTQIVEYQSINLDAVSGATTTSKAIIAAVSDALTLAELNLSAFSSRPEPMTEKEANIEKTTDVVIVGAGGAGLAAAVSAHQNGAHVIIVEKMPAVGGNTLISGSAYNAVDPQRQQTLGIEDSIDKHYQQTYEGGDKKGNPELIRVLVENAYPGIEWLEGLGMEFTDTVFTVLGGLWPRAHKPVKPLGTGFIDTYMSYIEANDIEILLETTATELVVDDDIVIGVLAEGKSGNTVTLNANNGVVIATGGFAANVDLRDEYNTQWPELTNLKSTNHSGATGDGLLLAQAAGANLINLEDIQLLPMGDPESGSLSGNIEQNVENRIFINKEGNRFVAEDERRDVMTKALMEQPGALMWVIVDAHSYETGDVKNNFNESIDELVNKGRAYKADSLEALAQQIGVNAGSLVNAVNTFNAAVDAGGNDEFGRTLFQDKIDTAPFYAGARVPTVHHTMGGIEINSLAQVLNKDGEVINGLFAAGEVTGGIHGSNRLGGNALVDITVFGRIAGASAALKK